MTRGIPHPAADYLDPEEGLNRLELTELQESRLLKMLPYAYEHSALTRSVWKAAGVHPRDIRSIADFKAKAPFIDQDALRDFRNRAGDPFAGALCVPLQKLAYVGTTSGTTGNPTPIAHSPLGPTETARGRELWMMGARPGDYVTIMLFSFRSGIDMLCERAPAIGIKRIFLSQTQEEIPRLFEITRQFRPTVLYMLSTGMIMAIDAYARQHGINVREEFACYRSAAYGGEPIGRWARRKLQEWGLTVVNMTAAGDAMPATECLERAGSHIWEDLCLAEHLQPGSAGTARGNQRGELVMTSLTDYATPLIRYRTSDFVLMNEDRCACGRYHVRIRTLGRTGDLVQVSQRHLMPSDVAPLLESIEACQAALFQMIIPRLPERTLRLKVGYDVTLTPNIQGLRLAVTEALSAALQVPVEVSMVDNTELQKLGPPHKIPRTVKL
jgi:phenylacetate-CoA ligase